jgi:hypothetical protein
VHERGQAAGDLRDHAGEPGGPVLEELDVHLAQVQVGRELGEPAGGEGGARAERDVPDGAAQDGRPVAGFALVVAAQVGDQPQARDEAGVLGGERVGLRGTVQHAGPQGGLGGDVPEVQEGHESYIRS